MSGREINWTSLEIAKLTVALTTPLLILAITLWANDRISALQRA